MIFHRLTLSLALALSAYALPNGLVVSTAQGSVLGTFVSSGVRQFLGIPYATANRWEAPTLPPSRKTQFSATEYSTTCPQNLNPGSVEFLVLAGLTNSQIYIPESEDCLTVNIWTPSTTRKQNAAVLLWVYGGAFQFGSSNIPTYNGQSIVENNDDIIVVTFNYRLNIFGFPSAPQLVANTSQPQNFGLLDLNAAVQWVHDNIAAFGGDPNRIVLFGQSAGGAAIDAYTFAYPQDTRVHGNIRGSASLSMSSESTVLLAELSVSLAGVLNSTVAPNTPGSWNTVANLVGCGNVSDATQLSCMKQVPSKQLEDAVISTNLDFGPIADGITIFADWATRAAAGNFLRVPLLGGTVQNEADVFVVDAELLAAGVAIPNLTELLADLETQGTTCSAGTTALGRVNANVPTWRYQYQAVFRDISTRPDLRAYHASELPVLFGTMPNPTSTEKALSRFMQQAWVAFATNPTQGLVNFGWPKYAENTSSLAQIGNFYNETGMTFTEGQLVDFTCGSLATLDSVSAQLTALL
ncbi:hypothetical protein H0H92_000743 [Tricholoma furcatifolium]|nr:hypothetical protein H0H92_000743 [Tricholoma furcatifolium]